MRREVVVSSYVATCWTHLSHFHGRRTALTPPDPLSAGINRECQRLGARLSQSGPQTPLLSPGRPSEPRPRPLSPSHPHGDGKAPPRRTEACTEHSSPSPPPRMQSHLAGHSDAQQRAFSEEDKASFAPPDHARGTLDFGSILKPSGMTYDHRRADDPRNRSR